MRIQSVTICDIKGIEFTEFKPGSLTVLKGGNGVGKSSVIDALLAIIVGGHDPGWLRRGARKGYITIRLDDGTEITKSVTAKGSTLEITDPEGHVIPAPQTFVNGLAESLAVDPGRLLLAKPKDVVDLLLELMPISFAAEEVEKAVGRSVTGDLDLDGIEKLRSQLYDERKSANKAARDAEGTVNDLRRALPEADEIDWKAQVSKIEAEREAARKEMRGVEDEIKEAAQSDEQTAMLEIQAKINALIEEREKQVRYIRAERDRKLKVVQDTAVPVFADLDEKIGSARERAEAQERAAGTRDAIARCQKRARELNGASERLSLAIEQLDALKKRKLDSLPVPGVEVHDGKAFVDGVPWEHVNRARLSEVAIQISALRRGDLPFMVVDDAEHFDAETWEAFTQVAAESGFQILAARVAEGPLKISTV